MKKLLLLITLISLPSYAAVSANVSFASDYIWRGMTQSDGPAIQGGFDYEADGGFYAGIWGSNVNFNDGAGSELDYYFGYAFEAGSIGVDLGYIAYDYPKNKTGLDFEEVYLGLSMGDLGLTFAMGRTVLLTIQKFHMVLETLVSLMVNMMITVIISHYPMDLVVDPMIVQLLTMILWMMVMVAMKMP